MIVEPYDFRFPFQLTASKLALGGKATACPTPNLRLRLGNPPCFQQKGGGKLRTGIPLAAMSCQGFDEKVGTSVFISGDELFDGGRRRSVKREREAQLAPAKENLAKADRRGRTRHARCLQQTRKNAADAAG
jgi:hypothetical protein